MALLDYLAARRAEIETQIKALRAELSEIKIAEAALGGAPMSKTVVSTPSGPNVVRQGSIKDWILKALALDHEGLETDDVIRAVLLMGGRDVPRSSMTPQLSRLKSAGLLNYTNGKWALSSRAPAQNDETPGVQPPDVPEDEDFTDLV